VTARQALRHFAHNIPVATSHCFLFESNGQLADSIESVGCIPHLPSVDMQVVETYDELGLTTI